MLQILRFSLVATFLLIGSLLAALPETQSTKEKVVLAPEEKVWLKEVDAIISDYERNAFLNLKTEEDRDSFREAFWEDRDPTRGTKRNEFKEEYEERLAYVKEYFGRESSISALKTDRGRTWLVLGKPQFRKRFPNEDGLLPIEFWHYRGIREFGLPESFYVLFYQKGAMGPYRIYSPAGDGPEALVVRTADIEGIGQRKGGGRRGSRPESMTGNPYYEFLAQIDPELAWATFSLLPTEGAYGGGSLATGIVSSEIVIGKLQGARNYQFDKREYVERIVQGRPKVEVYYSLGPQDVKSDIYWFQAPNGFLLLDFALQYAPEKFQMGQYDYEFYTSISMEATVQTAKGNQLVETMSSTHEIKLNSTQFKQIQYSPFQYLARRVIVPGDYKVSVILRNNLSKSMVPVVEDLKIPDFNAASAPYFSKVMLIQTTEEVKEGSKSIKPFEFGKIILNPLVDRRYGQNAVMAFFYQLFLPEKSLPLDSSTLMLEYELIQNDKSFAKQTYSFAEKFKDVQLTSGCLSFQDAIKITNAGLGNAKLIVRLRSGSKTIAESEAAFFQVDTSIVAKPWRLVSGIPPYDAPVHTYLLAQQYIRLNKRAEASELLKTVSKDVPSSLEIKLALIDVALKNKEYDYVLEMAHEIEIQNPDNKQLLWILGWTYYGKNQYDDSVRFFERSRLKDPQNVEVLNILADLYARLEKYHKSLELIEMSLSLNSHQPELNKLKQTVQKQIYGESEKTER